MFCRYIRAVNVKNAYFVIRQRRMKLQFMKTQLNGFSVENVQQQDKH